MSPANKCAKLSCGACKYSRGWPLPSQPYPASHHPAGLSRQKGTGNSSFGTAFQGFMGLLIHCVPGTIPGFPALPPAYRFIKYPQGSQSPEAGAGCRKVIHITNPGLRRTGRALGRPNRYPHPSCLPNAHQGD